MANKQKHNYSLGYNTRDRIKALAGSAKEEIQQHNSTLNIDLLLKAPTSSNMSNIMTSSSHKSLDKGRDEINSYILYITRKSNMKGVALQNI